MSEREKLSASHLRRTAFVYVRQSSQAQVERNVESTDRQYGLVERAVELGFAREQVEVIDSYNPAPGIDGMRRRIVPMLSLECTVPSWR